jgi:aryl-alcohol dehydrogenase-like predicted oxidoreductase
MPNLFSPNRLTLGTAQFGFNYGAFNENGQIPFNDIVKILDYAHSSGIDTLDTASGYGESELILGKYLVDGGHPFKIFTKMNKLSGVAEAVNSSLTNLHVDHCYGLLFHDYQSFRENPSLLQDLIEQKAVGRIQKVGFSLYYPDDLSDLLDSKVDFDVVQVQYSVFDQRFASLFPILKERGIEIHTRSVFLQGLYFANPDSLGAHFDTVKGRISELQSVSQAAGVPLGATCLNFALGNSYIDKVIIGVDNLHNLQDNINYLEFGNRVQVLLDNLKTLRVENIDILFPHFWKQGAR